MAVLYDYINEKVDQYCISKIIENDYKNKLNNQQFK